MSTKTNSVTVVTPPGRAAYPRLLEPDRKFKPEGEYTVGIIFNPADPAWAKFMAQVQEVYDAGYAAECKDKGKKALKTQPVFTNVVDKDTEEPTGELKFTAKMKAAGERKDGTSWEQRPLVVDAKKNAIQKAKVGSGSIIKVKVELRPYYVPALGYGVSFALRAVQVLELKEFSGGISADGFAEEEGYTYESAEAERGDRDGEF